MYLLGRHLADHKPLRIALTAFYGVSNHTSELLLARMQIPLKARVSDLTESQITALSSFLSSPSTSPRPAHTPLATPSFPSGSGPSSSLSPSITQQSQSSGAAEAAVVEGRPADPLEGIKVETDLRRSTQADIAHQRQVGSYRGRRHALGLPVRGQNTRNNAKTAKRLNRIERRAFSTTSSFARPAASPSSSGSQILALLGRQ